MDPKHIIAIAAYHAKQVQNAILILRLFLGVLARFFICIYILSRKRKKRLCKSKKCHYKQTIFIYPFQTALKAPWQAQTDKQV